jgi:RimJ/RimL family protein N-acetyltransferase
MAALEEVIRAGLHEPATMPFLEPFTDLPAPERTRSSYRYWFGTWANWSSDDWTLVTAAFERPGGAPARCVGCQALMAREFPLRRTVTTASFLGLAHQGRGLGREMRAAVLALAFDHLGAARAESEAFDDNTASRRVSEWLGYRPNGDHLATRRGERARVVRYALDRDRWEARRAGSPPLPTVTVEGLGSEVLAMFGAG